LPPGDVAISIPQLQSSVSVPALQLRKSHFAYIHKHFNFGCLVLSYNQHLFNWNKTATDIVVSLPSEDKVQEMLQAGAEQNVDDGELF
jgi:hypothetical protein